MLNLQMDVEDFAGEVRSFAIPNVSLVSFFNGKFCPAPKHRTIWYPLMMMLPAANDNVNYSGDHLLRDGCRSANDGLIYDVDDDVDGGDDGDDGDDGGGDGDETRNTSVHLQLPTLTKKKYECMEMLAKSDNKKRLLKCLKNARIW